MVSNNLTLLNELLSQIYTQSTKVRRNHHSSSSSNFNSRSNSRCRCSVSSNDSTRSCELINVSCSHSNCNFTCNSHCAFMTIHYRQLDTSRLHELIEQLTQSIHKMNSDLVNHLRHRDFLSTEQSQLCDFITATLQAISSKRESDAKLRFSIEAKTATDSSYKQWVDAMRMVVRLPGGIPPEFRRKLWITLSEKYIQSKQINWQGKIESCFSDRANPDDESLGEQIIKDLHRTGCDLFSGADASVNQALLKQVLLAFARWNKGVGYCQGFNILAAVILEVVEWKVEEALMVMIFLIEGLLPESYFANNLRGLSVDMAVFRDLMKIHLNDLSSHLDHLQYSSLEGVACYEPPLVNVFTLQWFLTLFSNCLPKSLVLRIWDLIFLEGSEVLLRTALVIWSHLSTQIYSVKSADEFYSIMGILMMQLMEFSTTDGNKLITDIIDLAEFPYVKVAELREKYTYHIRPLSSNCNSPSTHSVGSSSPFSFVKKGLHLLPFTSSSDEEEVNSSDHFDFFIHQDQLIASLPRPGSPCVGASDASTKDAGKSRSIINSSSPYATTSAAATGGGTSSASGTSSPDRMSLDVSLLRKQYAKLCQRQKQAHLILTEGLKYGYSSTFNRGGNASNTSSSNSNFNSNCNYTAIGEGNNGELGRRSQQDKVAINSLLSGKPALTMKKGTKQPMVALPSTSGKGKPGNNKVHSNNIITSKGGEGDHATAVDSRPKEKEHHHHHQKQATGINNNNNNNNNTSSSGKQGKQSKEQSSEYDSLNHRKGSSDGPTDGKEGAPSTIGKSDRGAKSQLASPLISNSSKCTNISLQQSHCTSSSSSHKLKVKSTANNLPSSDERSMNVTPGTTDSPNDSSCESLTNNEVFNSTTAKSSKEGSNRPRSACLSSQSSSTSINNSSSSSSLDSPPSSDSTVDTVVRGKNVSVEGDDSGYNNKDSAGGQIPLSDSAGKSTSSKSSIVVVRRRFGPNVRRASSILEQSSFSIDEPEGDDESTSSSEDEQGDKKKSNKNVTSRRKEFGRRHQDTMTLTWSEIRKIRKTSAPAAVIRSSLSSPPTDLSPCDDSRSKPVKLTDHKDDVDKGDVQQVGEIEEEEEEQEREEEAFAESNDQEPRGALVCISPVSSSKASSSVTGLCESSTTLPAVSDSQGAQKAQPVTGSPVEQLARILVEEQTHPQFTPVDAKEEQTVNANSIVSTMNITSTTPATTSSLTCPPSTQGESTETETTTKGPDEIDTEFENESELELDPPCAGCQVANQQLSTVVDESCVHPIEVEHPVTEGPKVKLEDESDGEERIIKSVQSEISELSIEECLARLSARISTLNSELQ